MFRAGAAPIPSLEIVDALLGAGPDRLVAWAAILDPGVHLRVGNRPPALGVDAAIRELGLLLADAAAARGCHREVWRLRGAVLVETELGVPGDAAGRDRIPVAVVLRVGGDGKAIDVRIYLDPSPLARARARARQGGGCHWGGATSTQAPPGPRSPDPPGPAVSRTAPAARRLGSRR